MKSFGVKIKNLFKAFAEKTRPLRALVMMQLKDKADLSFLRSTRDLLFKAVFFFLLFAAYCAMIYFVFSLGISLNVLTLTGRLPETFIIFIFTLMIVISVANCTFRLTKFLYLSSDNHILLTLPVRRNQIFLSKLIVFYIKELQKNVMFIVPLFWVFGFINGFGVIFFPWVVFIYFFISLLPVVLGALLSIPMLYITMFLRNFKILEFLIYLGIAAGIAVLVFMLIDSIPENFNIIQQFSTYYWQLQNFLEDFSKSFYGVFSGLTKMIVGNSSFFYHELFPASSLFTFLWMVLTIAACGILVYFLSRPLFLSMASKPFEYRKRIFERSKTNRRTIPYLSMLKKEALTSVRTPDAFIRDFGLIFILPLSIFLLNKIFASMNTRLQGDVLALTFNILLILLIVLCSNVGTASLLSREGGAFHQFKISPVSTRTKLLAKLSLKLFSSAAAVLLTCVLMLNFGKIGYVSAICMFFFITLTMAGHALWSLEMDMLNPRWQFYNDGMTTETNPNESKSYGIAFAAALLGFGISLFLFSENPGVAWIKLICIAACFLGLRIFQFAMNSRVYFKEM